VALLRTLPSTIPAPLVLDADGLFAWAGRAQGLATRKAPTVLTPHEGEAGRLLGVGAEAVRSGREAAATRLANLAGAVVVLKGPGTLVTDGSRCFRCSTGGPSLATGGTGDVLAGIVAAFLAAPERPGGDAFGAACAAVHLHGLAGDRAAGTSDRGVLASEVADAVPRALAAWLRGARRR
jgi:NAD(P)H-hydrate epimerase